MRKFVINLLILAVTSAMPLWAAANDSLIVSLSDPSKPATVRAEMMAGNITITSHRGDDVVIVTKESERRVAFNMPGFREDMEFEIDIPRIPELQRISSKEPDAEKVRGLTKVKSSGFGISVEEEDNVIDIVLPPASLFSGNVRDLNVQVPKQTSLNLECMAGNVQVEDIEGTIEVEAMGGQINLDNISGTIIAHTMGDITASVARITPGKPMSFSSFNGEIDVTLPADIKATVVLESHGNIYTDFDTSKRKVSQDVDEKEDDDRFMYDMKEVLEIPLNGGGPEIRFTNFSGNIYIRKGN